MTASTIIIIKPENIDVKAAGGDGSRGGDRIGINTTYIHSISQNLSDIVKKPGYPRGRSFGTIGEWRAANNISQWMNQIGLYNVHTEQINCTTQHPHLNETLDIVSMGIKINGTQTITDCFISPRWNLSEIIPNYDKNKLTYNCSENDPLPVYRKPYLPEVDNLFNDIDFSASLLENHTSGYIFDATGFFDFIFHYFENKFNFTFEDFDESNQSTYPTFLNESFYELSRRPPFLWIDEEYSFNPNVTLPLCLYAYNPLSLPRVFYNYAKLILRMLFSPLSCKGLILYDFNNDTYDMVNGLSIAKPILRINGSVGRPIYENTTYDNASNREISFWINQSYKPMKSYNVIGQINGTNPNKTVLIDCLYDCYWNQGTSDAAIGMGTVLALAKYFKDHHIKPKYTLKFVAFGGEEYGFLGAQHYADKHYNNTNTSENITTIIDLNQIGFSQTGPLPQTLFLHLNNASLISLIRCITNDTHYEERTGVPYLHINYTYYGAPSDDTPFAVNSYIGNRSLHTICFLKDMNWTLHHRDGQNHEKGDTMTFYNETDVNVTAEMIWNVTKYFTVNPNCWFDNVSITAFDSPNDGDTLNDSIRANFTIHSVLPSDKVRVELNLSYNISGSSGFNQSAGYSDYFLTSRSQNESYKFTIPDTVVDGNYSVSFKLYNSTGRINKIVDPDGTYYNDTSGTSNWAHLYHPLGYTKIGHSHKCIHDNISGSVFTANEYGEAQNITAHINLAYMSPGPYQCMLYQASDGALVGNTTSDWEPLPTGNPELPTSWWAVFNFTGEKPHLVKGTQYIITCWGDSPYSWVSYDESDSIEKGKYNSSSYGDPPNQVNFSNESRYYSIYCGYTPAIPQITNVLANPHTVGFGFNVTISANVSAPNGVNQVKVHIDALGGGFGVGNYTMTHTSGDTYQYVFPNTWSLGCYEYTIWVVDNMSYVNSSTGHHFHLSINATISIATLQDSYTGNQYINITDPPDPPENYSLVGRGLTWNEYYNDVTGQNILEVSTGPINYQEDNGAWSPINMTLSPLASNHPAYVYGYRNRNDQGLYGVYFKANAQQEWPVAFTYNRSDDSTSYVIRSKLVGVG